MLSRQIRAMAGDSHFFYTRCINSSEEIKEELWKTDPNTKNPIARQLIKGYLDKNVVIKKTSERNPVEFSVSFRIVPVDESGISWPSRAFSKKVKIDHKHIAESPEAREHSPCDILYLFELVKKGCEVNLYYRYGYVHKVPKYVDDDCAIVQP